MMMKLNKQKKEELLLKLFHNLNPYYQKRFKGNIILVALFCCSSARSYRDCPVTAL